LLTQQIHT